MIVAIADRKIIAHADLVTECAEKMLGSRLAPGMVRYRVASPALQALIESGASTEGLALVIGETVDLADDDIRRIREHVIARALENTK